MKRPATMLDHVRAVRAGERKLHEVPPGARGHVARLLATLPTDEYGGRPAAPPNRSFRPEAVNVRARTA